MELLDTKERPSYVRFERVAMENKAASLAAGHYVAYDIDYALITSPGSKDIFKSKAENWIADLKQQANVDRIPREWVNHYLKQYQAWKEGQELPLNGTPIRGWGVLSPAQQEAIIHNNVLTVEDLATLNEEGLRRIGMGAVQMKTKASAWVAQLQDKGPLVQEIAAVKSENAVLRTSLESLQRQVASLQEGMQRQDSGSIVTSMTQLGSELIDHAMAAPTAVLPDSPKRKRRTVLPLSE
jgi:hypothetical protein